MCTCYKLIFILTILKFIYITESIWYLEPTKDAIITNTIPITDIKKEVEGSEERGEGGGVKIEGNKKNESSEKGNVILNKTLYGGIKAIADSTYKGIGNSGFRKYDANNALTKGNGYWCSEGDLLEDRIITWTGILKVERLLRGIIITWEYKPSFISISTSRNESGPFEEIVPFRSCSDADNIQEISFPHKVDAKVIQIHMKGQINGYFGITFVQFIGEEDPLFRIQSGITSIEDMCLQFDNTGEVILDGCISSIANLEFNDLWKYNDKKQLYNPLNNLCMTLEDGLETNGGKIIMMPCNDYKDGRNSWDITSNNQIKLRRKGNLCLSQSGTSAGLVNVALNKIATSNYTLMYNNNHTAEKALDGNAKSYWLSKKFKMDDIPYVNFIINLQDVYKLRNIEINWIYPPMTFKIFTKKTQDDNWQQIKYIKANTLKNNDEYLLNQYAQFIKLDLSSPNPEFMYVSIQSYTLNYLNLRSNPTLHSTRLHLRLHPPLLHSPWWLPPITYL